MQVSVIICLFTKMVVCVCQVTHCRRTVGYRIRVRTYYYSSPHSRQGRCHLKITTFLVLNLKKNYISQLFLLKILDLSLSVPFSK